MASRLIPRIRPVQPNFLTITRFQHNMASSAAPRKYEWLVVVPDKPDTLAKRLEVRPTHFKNLQDKLDAGIFKMGGALLDEVPADDEPSSLKFNGSTLVCLAESREEVMGWLEKDVYAEAGVWDLEKVQLWPFKCAFRRPVEQ
ncbi:Protein YciI like protein [Verticillium longisporum]|uniref:YCII-related domain-containing protein n=3 Tax=Verticillium TaxID=1036719 RepID=G2WRP9_VERDV|nr:uncharacterized protein VDAG_00232 [Verticillium dahliae VdLs.17]KAF3344384.1 Mitogen-activated protein kinase spm1 [Verticillium dahliae VDG2]KAF3353641.1 hypothetical protein VdG1_08308 [Verticillium dahliae VDG1]KAG7136643.1 Protein YciI like protein [Verticillium longisporum]KAH6710002.1 hypothetical protein EV126DRAFT_514610 [Verticillium dahliae]EGY13550.1 hypothetical protein VDAG_00232 [Verticillium dahliae VdLs.17]